MKDYAHPEVLVDTQWLAEHLDDPKVRIVDIHLDPTLYESGHIPGAVFWPAIGTLLKPDWQINFDTQSVEDLCARSGIAKRHHRCRLQRTERRWPRGCSGFSGPSVMPMCGS